MKHTLPCTVDIHTRNTHDWFTAQVNKMLQKLTGTPQHSPLVRPDRTGKNIPNSRLRYVHFGKPDLFGAGIKFGVNARSRCESSESASIAAEQGSLGAKRSVAARQTVCPDLPDGAAGAFR
jgi:hypothetical protein